jgi:phospholipid/cholesterol/gamma-HCH transport system substrate-binding protein
MKRIPNFIKGPVIVAVVLAAMVVGVKASYGGFKHPYHVTLTLSRAGQQMQLGSDVREHGVKVGSVSNIQLVDRQAKLTLQIDQQYRIPSSSQAIVSLKTLLGAKFVDLQFTSMKGPFLADGGIVRTTSVGPELEDALADGTNVLDALQPADLATVVNQLALGARGHGQDVARGLVANRQLSTLFAQTLPSQLAGLHDFDVIFAALRQRGVDLNNLADYLNQGVPVYASTSAQKNLDDALKAIAPFANNLSDLFVYDRAAFDQMYNAGDIVLGAISSDPNGLYDLVHGLYRYVYKLGGDPYQNLGNGTASAGFTAFLGGNTNNQTLIQICGSLPPIIRDKLPICKGA